MEIKNFLFWHKSKLPLFAVLAVGFISGCSHFRTRSENEAGADDKKVDSSTGPVVLPKYEMPQGAPTPQVTTSPIPAIPKIGLILGPGGARSYGHIGFLQNLSKMKIPIYGAVGIEWGAPIAALLSSKGQVYDVEWQMFKLKDDVLTKKSLIGARDRNNEIGVLSDFFKTAFAGQKVEKFKYPFACPAYNLAKNQVYMMSRGSLENLLPYCIPYPPIFKPFNRNVSAIREVKMAADYLRSQGANYIVLVNVLGREVGRKPLVNDVDSAEAVIWGEVASDYVKPRPGVDAVIQIDLGEFVVTDFDKRREIMQKSFEVSQRPIEQWAKKLGF